MDLTQSLEIATCTDPGMVRSHNEDSIAADAANGLMVLADGMAATTPAKSRAAWRPL